MSILVLALCLVAAFACTAESRTHGKINALLKKMENTIALKNVVSEGRVETVAVEVNSKYDKCEKDGVWGWYYWCPGKDSSVGSCCSHQASNGNDGDWFCCDADDYPTICASTEAACDI